MNGESTLPPLPDPMAVHTWVYPSNFPVRVYQRDIVESALLQNTLVCLPTGLGKTLIAAVVMYNFYNWFPTGCVVFMAPTKPLVSQQVEACHRVVGIPEVDTAHLDGSVSAEQREAIWVSRRVVFCTPQTLENDMMGGNCDPRRIVCVVFDEAHRATGNYAYTKIIKLMERCNSQYRVLALSATPGRDVRAIQQIVHNLRISAIEVRSEDDEDVQQYVNQKQVEVVECRASPEAGSSGGDVMVIRRLLEVLARPRVARLHSLGLMMSDSVDRLSDFIVREALEYFERNTEELKKLTDSQISECRNDFKCVRLCVKWRSNLTGHNNAQSNMHLLHEIDTFIATMTKLHESRQRGLLKGDEAMVNSPEFQRLKKVVKKCASARAISVKTNPKLDKTSEIVEEHVRRYAAAGVSTRVIVFVATRASVQEVVSHLEGSPGLKPIGFVGQTAKKQDESALDSPNSVASVHAFSGLNQAEQEVVLSRFRAGEFNVLVATCIAEEGLDIGDVDLIICYDSVSSPLRLMQRMGRTGRKRSGRVVLLVLAGKDKQKVDNSALAANAVYAALRDAKKTLKFCPGHRVLPDSVTPFLQLQDLNLGSTLDRKKIAGNKVNSRAPGEVASRQLVSTKKPDISQWVIRGTSSSDQSPGDNSSPSTISHPNVSIAPEPTVFHPNNCLICGTVGAGASLMCSVCEISVSSEDAKAIKQLVCPPLAEHICVQDQLEDQHVPMGTGVPSQSYSTLIARARAAILDHTSDLADHKPLTGDDVLNLTPPDLEVFTSAHERQRSIRKVTKIQKLKNAHESGDYLIRAYFQASQRSRITGSNILHSMNGPNLQLSALSCDAWQEFSVSGGVPISKEQLDQGRTSGKQTSKSFIMPSFSSDEDSSDEIVGVDTKAGNRVTNQNYAEAQVATYVALQQPTPPLHHDKSHKLQLDAFIQSTPLPNGKAPLSDDFPVPIPFCRETAATSSALKLANHPKVRSPPPAKSSDQMKEMKNTKCSICTGSVESGMKGRLVQCLGPCGSYVHCACYGLGAALPDDRFECEGCWSSRMTSTKECCSLCKSNGGLLRLSQQENAWVHPICVLFTPELTVDDRSLRANNLDKLDPDRSSLSCLICRRQGGSCVQCCFPSCLVAIHPYCAFRASKQLLIRGSSLINQSERSQDSSDKAQTPPNDSFEDAEDEDGDGDSDVFSYEYYCDAHINKILNTDEVISSIVPIQFNEKRSRGVSSKIAAENEKNLKKTTEQAAIAMQRTPQKGSNMAKRSLSQLLSIEEEFASPQLLREEPSRVGRKRLKRLRDAARDVTAGGFSVKPQHEERSGKLVHKKKSRIRDTNWRFLDVEAALDSDGPSASDDECVGDSDEDKLSGDFINDGDYTQASPGLDAGVAMYMALNRNMTQSPDFYNIKTMLGSRAGRRNSKSNRVRINSARNCDSSGAEFSEEFDELQNLSQSPGLITIQSRSSDQSNFDSPDRSDIESPDRIHGFAKEWAHSQQYTLRGRAKTLPSRQICNRPPRVPIGFSLPSSSGSSSEEEEEKEGRIEQRLIYTSAHSSDLGACSAGFGRGVLTAADAALKITSKKRPMK